LANIVLDELDNELERRGLRFVRYDDDWFTRSAGVLPLVSFCQ